MTLILFLLISFSGFAQQFNFKADGTFLTKATPGSPAPTTVNYSISWNETSKSIQGIYQDNYFARSSPMNVTGKITSENRTFTILFPDPINGARQIVMSTGSTGLISGSAPFIIKTLDSVGSVIDNSSSFGLIKLFPDATTATSGAGATPGQETLERKCIIGFGVLSKMCGLYGGLINEIQDSNNRCELTGGALKLELGLDSTFRLYPNYIIGANTQLAHTIGSFLPSPLSQTISVTRQECEELPGTSFIPGNCRTLILSGTFSNIGNSYYFAGDYTINDNVNADVCRFNLMLNREVSY
jgi:hypothetical protein